MYFQLNVHCTVEGIHVHVHVHCTLIWPVWPSIVMLCCKGCLVWPCPMVSIVLCCAVMCIIILLFQVSTLSPVSDQPRDSLTNEPPFLLPSNSPPIIINSNETNQSTTVSSKTSTAIQPTLQPPVSSSQLHSGSTSSTGSITQPTLQPPASSTGSITQPTLQPPLSSTQLYSGSASSIGSSTTVITTDKKKFVIEDVSFNNEDNFNECFSQDEKGAGVKGGFDSETTSQCGGLESASTNSMQSDSHVQQDSTPYLPTDNGIPQLPPSTTGPIPSSSQPPSMAATQGTVTYMHSVSIKAL